MSNINSTTEQALTDFDSGLNCCQATLASLCETALDRETALKISSVFGGGICRSGETCGAVTGALMAIGLKHGTVLVGDTKAKENAYIIGKQFIETFKQHHRFTRCKDLLGCDLSTEAGAAFAKQTKIQKTVCPQFLKDAIEITEEILKSGST